MSDSSYYPAGAYSDPSAPYNEVSRDEIEMEQEVSCTLYGIGTFKTDEYIGGGYDEEGKDPEEYTGDRKACYMVEEQMYTPLLLLGEYANILEELLSNDVNVLSKEQRDRIQLKIDSCRMWTEEEYDNRD